MFVHADDDAVGQRIAAGQLMALGLARQDELSAAFAVNRSTLYRQGRKLATAGVLGVVDGKRGPRGPHRFTAEKRERAQGLLAEGVSMRQAAQQVGVSEGTIRHVRLAAVRWAGPRRPGPSAGSTGPACGAERDASAPGGGRCSGTPNGRWREWVC